MDTIERNEVGIPATPVAPEDHVVVVDERYQRHDALVTAVHGTFGNGNLPPCINVAYVSGDPTKRDPYGQQIERMSSLQHLSQGPSGMNRPGRYWVNADVVDLPGVKPEHNAT